LAFLALQDRAVRRDLAAGLPWPDVSEDRARGSLRSALARFGEIARRASPPSALVDSEHSPMSAEIVELQRSRQSARAMKK
jgi:DNA-binding SARP family transcriptional activator